MKASEIGLGSALRALIASIDGGVQALYDAEGERFRPRFYPIVCLLLRHHVLRVSELADLCGVSQPAMTQTLSAMQREGIVETGAGTDRRERQISLTSAGRAQAERLTRLWTATARAASTLESECETPLAASVARLLVALAGKPFIDRIKEEL
jgi:DNA-binding MarR family transcriptional regulator